MKYNFDYSNKHIVVEIDGSSYIVDTGSPISFSTEGHSDAITINGSSFDLENNPMGTESEGIEQLVGRKIDGLIGLDILEELNSVYMNKAEGYIEFDASDAHSLSSSSPIKLNGLMGMGFLEAPVKVKGEPMQAILDSGACVSYVNKKLVNGCKFLGQISDYAPAFGGEITTDKYEVELSFCGNDFTAAAAVMTPIIEMSVSLLGYKVILGFGEMQWNELCIDIANGKISYN